MSLKPLKIKECNDGDYRTWTCSVGDRKSRHIVVWFRVTEKPG